MPIFSVFRVCKIHILYMGNDMMIKSLAMFVAIKDWIIGTYAPHVPCPVHCAEIGWQMKMQAHR